MSDIQQRLLSRVEFDTNGGCWLWGGCTTSSGYGAIMHLGAKREVHRLSWRTFRGDLGGLLVLHRCDVRACLNPDHLFLGTGSDNMVDMAKKGRGRSPGGYHRVSAEQRADFVRRHTNGESCRAMARDCGVAAKTVARALLNKPKQVRIRKSGYKLSLTREQLLERARKGAATRMASRAALSVAEAAHNPKDTPYARKDNV